MRLDDPGRNRFAVELSDDVTVDAVQRIAHEQHGIVVCDGQGRAIEITGSMRQLLALARDILRALVPEPIRR